VATSRTETTVNDKSDKKEFLEVYPNPVNESTVIKYYLKERSNVTLKIYDVLGNEVACLVNETMEKGEYLIPLNINRMANGVYFIKLELNSDIISKMIMITK
jgi:hypothetical protein